MRGLARSVVSFCDCPIPGPSNYDVVAARPRSKIVYHLLYVIYVHACAGNKDEPAFNLRYELHAFLFFAT